MQKNTSSKFQKNKCTTLKNVLLIGILALITQPLAAQYFTKIETGTLVQTPKKPFSASFADYNGDGFDDMLIVDNDDFHSSLFTNNGDGTFTEVTNNIIYDTMGPSIACTWGDYNNDGNVDLYICNTANYGDAQAVNFLYRNDGNGTFTRIMDGAIVNDQDWSLGAAWADYDNDGFIDLFVVNFLQENCLYRNNGDSTFTKITQGDIVTDNFNSFSANWVDYDNDGFQDLYVINYFFSGLPGQNNNLYHNNGDGTFTKNTTSILANDAALTQGSSWGDFNNDGLMDVFITVNDFGNVDHNLLYKNIGGGDFELVNASPSTDGGAVFGSAWLDMDNDGFLDLTTSNNGGSQERLNNLYRNNGDETFTDQITDPVTNTTLRDYCVTISDYNNDGYQDIFTPSYSTTLVHGLYENNGGSNNWISLRLEGMISNKSGIGARVYCTANGITQTREVSSTSGQYTGSTLVQTFGIGAATSIDNIQIQWPSGIIQVLDNPAINQIYNILEETAVDSGTDILSFDLAAQSGPANIDAVAHTVMVEVASGTDLSALTPTITVSSGATINPASGETVDFSNGAVSYIVTAEDGTDTQEWMVTVTVSLGINEQSNSNFTIYPNPTTTNGAINITATASGNYDLTVINYLGQQIKNIKVSLQIGNNNAVNLGSLSQGMYFISLYNDDVRAVFKLMVSE